MMESSDAVVAEPRSSLIHRLDNSALVRAEEPVPERVHPPDGCYRPGRMPELQPQSAIVSSTA